MGRKNETVTEGEKRIHGMIGRVAGPAAAGRFEDALVAKAQAAVHQRSGDKVGEREAAERLGESMRDVNRLTQAAPNTRAAMGPAINNAHHVGSKDSGGRVIKTRDGWSENQQDSNWESPREHDKNWKNE